jgi:glycosyltransferase involved in cell wall biosynthesis
VGAAMSRSEAIFRAKYQRLRVIAIARDEAAAVGGFFRQFLPLTGDFCLLDTGSSDATLDEAQAAGARIERAPFTDFASARNEALSRFAAGADWIVMLDPDERLDPHTIEHLRGILFGSPFDILLAPLVAIGRDGARRGFVPKPFCFRAHATIRWVFAVHEKLVGSRRQALVANATIEHGIALHSTAHRASSEDLYARLMATEPFFVDPAYRERMRQEWPILDYDRTDDPRIVKTHAGPLVSVVVPTSGADSRLAAAVASILAQDYASVEALVVGPAGRELARHEWPEARVRVLGLPPSFAGGVAAARNHGIAGAAGELIAYLDEDKRWLPNHLSGLYEVMRAAGASFVFGSAAVEGRERDPVEPGILDIDPASILHRRDLIAKYGGWSSSTEVGYPSGFELLNRCVQGGETWARTQLSAVQGDR